MEVRAKVRIVTDGVETLACMLQLTAGITAEVCRGRRCSVCAGVTALTTPRGAPKHGVLAAEFVRNAIAFKVDGAEGVVAWHDDAPEADRDGAPDGPATVPTAQPPRSLA